MKWYLVPFFEMLFFQTSRWVFIIDYLPVIVNNFWSKFKFHWFISFCCASRFVWRTFLKVSCACPVHLCRFFYKSLLCEVKPAVHFFTLWSGISYLFLKYSSFKQVGGFLLHSILLTLYVLLVCRVKNLCTSTFWVIAIKTTSLYIPICYRC